MAELRAPVEHLTLAERAANGRAARADVPRSVHATWSRLPAGPTRSPCWRSKRQPGCRSWCRSGTAGCSSRRSRSTAARRCLMAADLADHAERRAGGAAVRRRAPVELRRVRLPGSATGLRHQRLRRDPARPVRVGRQAARRQLRGRRPGHGLRHQARAGRQPGRAAGRTARRCAGSPMRTLDVWYAHLDIDAIAARCRRQLRPDAAKRVRDNVAKAQDQGQHARRSTSSTASSTASRGIVSDPPLIVPIERAVSRTARRRESTSGMHEMLDSYRRTPPVRPSAPARAFRSSTWPARSSASAASAPAPGSC